MKYLILFVTLALTACSTVRVSNVKTAPGADLGKYKTFGFYELKASGDTIPEKFNERVAYLKASIAEELTRKGYQSAANPQLLVNIGIVVQEKVDTRTTNWQTDGRYRYVGQRNYSWKSEEIEVGRYREGTVTLHLVDAASNNMVWQGTVNRTIPDKKEKAQAAVKESVAKLFASLPAR